jgi:hypothetical protein
VFHEIAHVDGSLTLAAAGCRGVGWADAIISIASAHAANAEHCAGPRGAWCDCGASCWDPCCACAIAAMSMTDASPAVTGSHRDKPVSAVK